jgi:hypothetical protein
MRGEAPFRRDDLRQLGEFLERAEEVVAMREIAAGERHPNVIGLRHDMDNFIRPSVELAEWERRHGFRATYFVLHDSPYWESPDLRPSLERIAELGHEIGIHANALSVALDRGVDPDAVLWSAVDRLRSWGHTVTGVAAHGDRDWCYDEDRKVVFVNDEQFIECARPNMGAPDRTIRNRGRELTLRPRSLADFGLTYESLRAGPRAHYWSDSGGRWNQSYAQTARDFPDPSGQLHILIHPCWWFEAFPAPAEVAA